LLPNWNSPDSISQIAEGKWKIMKNCEKSFEIFCRIILTIQQQQQQISFCRNESLIKNGFKAPMATKTGTTIVGIIYKDGVILGADTRATSGNIVSDKNCEKIHFLAKNM
jgi:hypothetical protein